MNEVKKENQLRIANASRIERILGRICLTSLQVLVKAEGPKPLSIRGRATHLELNGPIKTLRISNISEKGMAILATVSTVHVEFVGMATQVIFDSSVVGREQNSVLLVVPTLLTSVERRQNTRFVATPDFTSFVKMSLWNSSQSDLSAPPILYNLAEQSNWIVVADISDGGFCAFTRFPSALGVLRSGLIDERAKLYLPMRAPLSLKLEIRWIRKVKELVKVGDQNFEQRSFRFGLQFVSLDEESKLGIRQYMQQLTTATAI